MTGRVSNAPTSSSGSSPSGGASTYRPRRLAVWFGGFILLTAYARDFMSRTPIGSLSWAYILALSLVVMTWPIAWMYLRWCDRHLAPLAERLNEEEERR